MPQSLAPLIWIALVVINTAGFVIAGADKRKAKKRRWRIPEKVFFLVSALGGAVGIYAGLLFFRHKTRHWYFMLGIPAIFLAQVALLFWVWFTFLS